MYPLEGLCRFFLQNLEYKNNMVAFIFRYLCYNQYLVFKVPAYSIVDPQLQIVQPICA